MNNAIRVSVLAIFVILGIHTANGGDASPLPRGLITGGKLATYDPAVPEELRVRDGLPNLFAKLEAGGPVRIAYLGGSITAANGWRPKTLAWFKTQFPKADVIKINAAISGTGSDYGACRITGDVLARNPDLVFMEHRVNGGGGFEAKSVEGILRQIWKKNPHTDICLVYTVSAWMLKDLQASQTPRFGTIMETVANAYGIPSIDLGVEIARREKAGSLIFKAEHAGAWETGILGRRHSSWRCWARGLSRRNRPFHAHHEVGGKSQRAQLAHAVGIKLLGNGLASAHLQGNREHGLDRHRYG